MRQTRSHRNSPLLLLLLRLTLMRMLCLAAGSEQSAFTRSQVPVIVVEGRCPPENLRAQSVHAFETLWDERTSMFVLEFALETSLGGAAEVCCGASCLSAKLSSSWVPLSFPEPPPAPQPKRQPASKLFPSTPHAVDVYGTAALAFIIICTALSLRSGRLRALAPFYRPPASIEDWVMQELRAQRGTRPCGQVIIVAAAQK